MNGGHDVRESRRDGKCDGRDSCCDCEYEVSESRHDGKCDNRHHHNSGKVGHGSDVDKHVDENKRVSADGNVDRRYADKDVDEDDNVDKHDDKYVEHDKHVDADGNVDEKWQSKLGEKSASKYCMDGTKHSSKNEMKRAIREAAKRLKRPPPQPVENSLLATRKFGQLERAAMADQEACKPLKLKFGQRSKFDGEVGDHTGKSSKLEDSSQYVDQRLSFLEGQERKQAEAALN
eukprot:TRINITY_DN40146_c0_g1_i1.p2 TRINITY_DN40146_c0_g1~~TRINITY_DN40146_c0_g1_i1.p2  ORF type:complete len:233 (-),score=48.49 TRINITY_DN40146_c0_g1_i1:750-1448(-)